jgi:hypothetical protein
VPICAGEGDHPRTGGGAGAAGSRALEGLANLRGKVLPIISLRRLFGFPELEHDDSTRALVIDVGQPLGFVVDRFPAWWASMPATSKTGG